MFNTINPGQVVKFTYKNYKGEVAERTAVFRLLQYGSNDYHKNEQFFLGAFCLDKNAYRSFSINDISNLKILG